MLTLSVLDIVDLCFFFQSMVELLFSCFGCSNETKLFQILFLEVITLDFSKVKLCFQAMIKFLFLWEQLVCYLDHRVIVSETFGIAITSQLIRNITLEIVFNLKHEPLLNQRLLQQDGFDVKDVDQVTDSKQESDFDELLINDLLIKLISKHDPRWSLLIHLHAINLRLIVDVWALALVKQTEGVVGVYM